MPLKVWFWFGWCLLALGLLITYGVIVHDAIMTAHYLHVFTLTPLIPYMLGAIFVYRQRQRTLPLKALVLLSLVMMSVGVPLFLWLYTPEAATVLKARVILLVPVVQAAVIGLVGAWLEIKHRTPRKQASPTDYPLY